MTDDDGVGARVRRYRQELGMTLTDLANAAQVSKSHLSVLENGTGSRPGAKVLYALANALGVTMADLLGRELQAVPRAGEDVPESLLAFARERDLPESDVRMLAGIQFRGDRPRTKDRWAFIYNAIATSSQLDRGSEH